MKRKMTNAQMQESIAELTDDVTELKEEGQKARAWREGADKQFNTIFEALGEAAETIRQTAIHQLRYEQQANKRMTRVEATIQEVSDNQKLYEQRADERLTRLEKTVQRVSDNQKLYEQRADERLTRLEKSVQKLSNTVDRYLSARRNGGSKN